MKKIIIPIVTTIIGVIMGLVYFQATEVGFFVSWKSLGIPPEFPVEFSGITYTDIFVKTENNKYYVCDSYLASVNCWKESKFPEEKVIKGESCHASDIRHLIFNKPNSEIIVCEHTLLLLPEAYIDSYYVTTISGEIWAWIFFSPSISRSYSRNLPLYLFSGTMSGLFVGFLVLKTRNARKFNIVQDANDSSS